MINKKVILGAIAVALLFLLYFYLLLNGLSYRQEVISTPRADLEVIPAEKIPTVDTSLLIVTPTPTTSPRVEAGGVTVQKYVKIAGTGGVGLRIRKSPGIDADVVFLANESELFIVVGGPEEKDNILWWQLSTPYDEARSGWASADYLTPITED